MEGWIDTNTENSMMLRFYYTLFENTFGRKRNPLTPAPLP